MTTTAVLWTMATQNPHKVEEIASLLEGAPVTLRSLPEGVRLPPETGRTLLANAQIKARAAAKTVGGVALADDTGLEVDALGGEPGVRSARYAGEAASYDDNCRKLLERLSGIHGTNRRARFRCVLVLADPSGSELWVEGRVEGFILEERRGSGGFGYDPVFLPDGETQTLAELSPEAKNALSHRGLAVQNLRQQLERLGRWSP